MKNKLMGLLRDDAGQAMTEYGLIIALVAVVVLVALAAIGTNLSTTFQGIADKLHL